MRIVIETRPYPRIRRSVIELNNIHLILSLDFEKSYCHLVYSQADYKVQIRSSGIIITRGFRKFWIRLLVPCYPLYIFVFLMENTMNPGPHVFHSQFIKGMMHPILITIEELQLLIHWGSLFNKILDTRLCKSFDKYHIIDDSQIGFTKKKHDHLTICSF